MARKHLILSVALAACLLVAGCSHSEDTAEQPSTTDPLVTRGDSAPIPSTPATSSPGEPFDAVSAEAETTTTALSEATTTSLFRVTSTDNAQRCREAMTDAEYVELTGNAPHHVTGAYEPGQLMTCEGLRDESGYRLATIVYFSFPDTPTAVEWADAYTSVEVCTVVNGPGDQNWVCRATADAPLPQGTAVVLDGTSVFALSSPRSPQPDSLVRIAHDVYARVSWGASLAEPIAETPDSDCPMVAIDVVERAVGTGLSYSPGIAVSNIECVWSLSGGAYDLWMIADERVEVTSSEYSAENISLDLRALSESSFPDTWINWDSSEVYTLVNGWEIITVSTLGIDLSDLLSIQQVATQWALDNPPEP